jgi:hypothetical protein
MRSGEEDRKEGSECECEIERWLCCRLLLFPEVISVSCWFRGQSRPLAFQMTVRHTGVYFSLKSASKLMQPTSSAVNRGTNVSGQIVIL